MTSASSSLRTGRRSMVVARSAEAPHLRALAAALPKQRYAFLSIDADGENAASVFAFHRYYGLRYAALLDPSARAGSFSAPGAPGPISTRYRVESYPTFYVLAPNGRIVWRSDGGAARRAPAPRAQARQPEWAKAAAVCLTAAAPTELFCFV